MLFDESSTMWPIRHTSGQKFTPYTGNFLFVISKKCQESDKRICHQTPQAISRISNSFSQVSLDILINPFTFLRLENKIQLINIMIVFRSASMVNNSPRFQEFLRIAVEK